MICVECSCSAVACLHLVNHKKDVVLFTKLNNTAYKVGDVWYDVAEGAYNEGLEAGAGGKFYVDQFGKIAAFVEDSALAGGLVGSYGYVIAVAAVSMIFPIR